MTNLEFYDKIFIIKISNGVFDKVKIGYARVSTEDQNLEMQLDALTGAGCETIFSDKANGAKGERPGLRKAIDASREGDHLMVWKLDRLGRSVSDLIALAASLRQRGVEFSSLSDGISTRGASGKFFFHVMAAFAEMERELIRERTLAGIAAAKARGRVGGRPRSLSGYQVDSIEELIRKGAPLKDIARDFEVSIPTLYRYFPVSSLRRV